MFFLFVISNSEYSIVCFSSEKKKSILKASAAVEANPTFHNLLKYWKRKKERKKISPFSSKSG